MIIVITIIGLIVFNILFCFALCRAASDRDKIESEEMNYYTNNNNTFIS